MIVTHIVKTILCLFFAPFTFWFYFLSYGLLKGSWEMGGGCRLFANFLFSLSYGWCHSFVFFSILVVCYSGFVIFNWAFVLVRVTFLCIIITVYLVLQYTSTWMIIIVFRITVLLFQRFLNFIEHFFYVLCRLFFDFVVSFVWTFFALHEDDWLEGLRWG